MQVALLEILFVLADSELDITVLLGLSYAAGVHHLKLGQVALVALPCGRFLMMNDINIPISVLEHCVMLFEALHNFWVFLACSAHMDVC